MGINFVPDAGDVLMCNFDGFAPPEMTKVRRVIVLSPRSRLWIPKTYQVVPVSKTPPASADTHYVEFKRNSYAFFDPTESVWAKADMVTCVAAWRLDRVRVNGRYSGASLRRQDLQRVRMAVLKALGIEGWEKMEVIVTATVIDPT